MAGYGFFVIYVVVSEPYPTQDHFECAYSVTPERLLVKDSTPSSIAVNQKFEKDIGYIL
jgi:hypothetical protein